MTDADLTALWITLKLATVSTLMLVVLGTPLAWWLARTRWKQKYLLEALVAMPLVLPPTVLGFYLLIAMSPSGALAWVSRLFGMETFAFSFVGLVIGSVIYSLPFVIQPLQSAFAMLDKKTLEAAATLGAGRWDRFFNVALPLAKPGFISAVILGFAHTLGEFGVVLMIGGNIPGETQVASIAIYEHVETLQYAQAHWLAGSVLLISFALLVVVYRNGVKLRFFQA